MEPIEDVVMKYFSASQQQDYQKMRGYLALSFEFDSGMQKFLDADEYMDFCERLPAWGKVTLLDSMFTAENAVLLYEGISQFGARFRVAEFIHVTKGKITKIRAVYSPLSHQQ